MERDGCRVMGNGLICTGRLRKPLALAMRISSEIA
jgi:hypothetical protein